MSTWQEIYLNWEHWWFPITFIASTAFVLYYGIFAPWYKTPFGQALVTVDLGLAVSTFPGFVKFLFHSSIYDNIGVAVTIMVIASFVPVAIVYRIITLFNIRNRNFWKNFSAKGKSTMDPEAAKYVEEAKHEAYDE